MGLMFINGRSKGLAIAILNRRQDDLLFFTDFTDLCSALQAA